MQLRRVRYLVFTATMVSKSDDTGHNCGYAAKSHAGLVQRSTTVQMATGQSLRPLFYFSIFTVFTTIPPSVDLSITWPGIDRERFAVATQLRPRLVGCVAMTLAAGMSAFLAFP